MTLTIVQQIDAATKDALKSGEKERLSTLRLMRSELKNKEIAARGKGPEGPLDDAAAAACLAHMIKQRQESADIYAANNRPELAAKEVAEISYIKEFLPEPLSVAELDAAIEAAVQKVGATSPKEMGAVIAELKAQWGARLDARLAAEKVKTRLG